MKDKDIKEKLERGLTVCLKCGFSGEEIQGEYPSLYKGYGCPICHSTLVVKKSKLVVDKSKLIVNKSQCQRSKS